MKKFPFPDKENSMQELRGDYVFYKIEKEQIEIIFEDAWSVGVEQARRFLEKHRVEDSLKMWEILQKTFFQIQFTFNVQWWGHFHHGERPDQPDIFWYLWR